MLEVEGSTGTRRDQRGWRALHPLLLRLHFYAGVLVAPLLVVAAATGLLYAFTPQLEEVVYDQQLHVPPGGAHVPLQEQAALAAAELPGAELRAVRPAAGPEDSAQIIFEAPDLPESHYRTAFVDPYRPEVLGVLETYGSGQALPLRTWVDELHRGLHLGDAGRLYSELAASWLWVLVLGGAALWIGSRARRARAVLLPVAGPRGRRRVRSWHGVTGIWLGTGLLFLSATGLTWSVHAGSSVSTAREALSWQTPEVSTTSTGTAGDVGLDAVHRIAEGRGLTGPVEITPPDGGAYQVKQVQRSWPTQEDSIAVDPGGGQVLDVVRFDDYPLPAKLSRWGTDAHMGLLFGIPNQIALVLVAGGLLCLVFWGYRMWWLRGPAGFAAPPARGAWRNVPGRVLAPALVLLAFIGYALPLLGISLLVFAAVDLLRARLRRDRAV